MPKALNGMGYSDYSPKKQKDFTAIIQQHLAAAKRDLPYYYLDLYSGEGYLPEYGDGSPLIFLKNIPQGLCTFALFIDRNAASIIRLRELTAGYTKTRKMFIPFGCEDIFTVMDLVFDVLKMTEEIDLQGLVYVDANGIPDFNLLIKLLNTEPFRKLDVLLNIPAGIVKLHMRKRATIVDYLMPMAKTTWAVREPIGRLHWSMLFGTNSQCGWITDTPLIPIKTEMGLKIFKKANNPKNQQLGRLKTLRIIDRAGRSVNTPDFRRIEDLIGDDNAALESSLLGT
jgi:hypothetical protein